MISSQHVNFLWELHFQSHEQADCLKRMIASINIIAKENIVVTFDIACFIWNAPKIKEPHQILILAMDISENFNRRINAQHHRLLLDNFLALISQGDDVFAAEGEIARSVELGGPFSWSEQMVQEQRVESVNGVDLFGLNIFFGLVGGVLLLFLPVEW